MSWFAHDELAHPRGVFLIREQYIWREVRCNIWLVKGKDADLLVDTGTGVENLREYLEPEGLLPLPLDGSRPLYIVLTHIHFDHSGGAFDFIDHPDAEIFCQRDGVEQMGTANAYHTLNFLSSRDLIKPHSGVDSCGVAFCRPCKPYRVRPTPCMPVSEGHQFDLGNRVFEVLETPGHSRESLCLFSMGTSTSSNVNANECEFMFSGDFVYDGGLIDWLPSSSRDEYISSAEKVRMLPGVREKAIIFPGHFEVMSGARLFNILDDYVENGGSLGKRKCNLCCFGTLVKMYFCMVRFFRC